MLQPNLVNKICRLRNRHFISADLFILLATPFLSLYIRLDSDVNLKYYAFPLLQYTILFTLSKLFLFYFMGLYKVYWRAASVDELGRLISIGFATLLVQNFFYIVGRNTDYLLLNKLPLSIAFIDGYLSIVLISTFRFSIRLMERFDERFFLFTKEKLKSEKVLIIGAGFAGVSIVHEMQRNRQINLTPAAFIDDDPGKLHSKIRGILVSGNRYSIPSAVKFYKINKIIIAMPSVSGSTIREISDICHKTNVETLTVPGIYEILNGKVCIDTVRKIKVEDLLRREPINIDCEGVERETREKRILITGAGGSIGSEICRQLLKFNTSEIILFGHGENSIFEIEEELKYLKRRYLNSETSIVSKIADIKDRARVKEVFKEIQPDIVFHAAAHKHVPLMELNPVEAITNNIYGTMNIVEISAEYNVENFIMISSDKAVNPTNIMGATKRVAEMITLQTAQIYGNKFSVVRFGNVLGSRGSVLHTFNRQIQNRDPITITHPEITRYFMTIPEAVQLVLQASILNAGGEIFMLDMGKPVKLMDLARDLIRLSGLREKIDIDFKIIGLRPGEKLYEELFLNGEEYKKTQHEKILIASNASRFIISNLQSQVNDFINNVHNMNLNQIYMKLNSIVPEFQCIYKYQDGLKKFSPKKEKNIYVEEKLLKRIAN